MAKKSKAGRHWFDCKTAEDEKNILSKLEDAFMNAFTDKMACLYAGISEASLYRYCEAYPAFRERKELLKDSPNLVAQKTLVGDLTNTAGARWWAEHRMDEFKPKTKVEHSGSITTDKPKSEEEQEVVDRFETELRATIAKGRTQPAKT